MVKLSLKRELKIFDLKVLFVKIYENISNPANQPES